MTSRREGNLLRTKRTKPITSMATIIIIPYIILYHESFLLLGNHESITVILVIKRLLMLSRPSTDLDNNSLVLFFSAVTLGKSPYFPEPQLPHLEDEYDNAYVTRLFCCSNGAQGKKALWKLKYYTN